MGLSDAALLVIDMQMDFLPGGALAVPDGDAILDPLETLMRYSGFGLIVATQDWHPRGHASFASSHPGRQPFESISLHGHEQVLWPDHCVENTAGAELHDALPWGRAAAIIRKGTDPAVDSYSGFRNNWDAHGRRPRTGLAGFLRERGTSRVYVCGLARDYCVNWTALDAAETGFETYFIWDLTRAVEPQSDLNVAEHLRESGVAIVDSQALARIGA